MGHTRIGPNSAPINRYGPSRRSAGVFGYLPKTRRPPSRFCPRVALCLDYIPGTCAKEGPPQPLCPRRSGFVPRGSRLPRLRSFPPRLKGGLRWEEPTAGPPLGRALRRAAMAPAPPGPPRWTPSCGRRSCHCALRKGHRRSIRCRSTRTACVVGAGQSGPARKAKAPVLRGFLGRARQDSNLRPSDS